jgi:hypothetical protein
VLSVAPLPTVACRSHRRPECLWSSQGSACWRAARPHSRPVLTPYYRTLSVYPKNSSRYHLCVRCRSCGVCGGVVNNIGHTFRRLRSCQALRTSARSSTTHQLPSPTAPAYPPIASPSSVNMPLLGRKFPAQVGTSGRAARKALWKSRDTANGRPIAAKPMWPFYVSGTSRTPNAIRERGGTRGKR